MYSFVCFLKPSSWSQYSLAYFVQIKFASKSDRCRFFSILVAKEEVGYSRFITSILEDSVKSTRGRFTLCLNLPLKPFSGDIAKHRSVLVCIRQISKDWDGFLDRDRYGSLQRIFRDLALGQWRFISLWIHILYLRRLHPRSSPSWPFFVLNLIYKTYLMAQSSLLLPRQFNFINASIVYMRDWALFSSQGHAHAGPLKKLFLEFWATASQSIKMFAVPVYRRSSRT